MFKRVVLLIILLTAGTVAYAQQSPIQQVYQNRTTTGFSNPVDLTGTGARYHRIIFYPGSGVATCQAGIQYSVDRISWSALIADQTCTSAGLTAATTQIVNYVRIDLSTISGGSVTLVYQGFQTSPETFSGTVAIDQSVPGVTNAVNAAVSGFKGNNVAAPDSTGVQAVGAVANAAHQSVTEGRGVLLSTDNKQNLRTLVCDAGLNDRCANVDANNNIGVVAPFITYNATQPTKTDQQTVDLQVDNRGDLKVIQGVGGFATDAESATAGAVPAKAMYTGAQNSSGLAGMVTCDSFIFDRSNTADVQLVAASGSTIIRICGYVVTGESTTTSDVNLRYATASDCTTGAANVTPPITVGTSTSGAMIGGVSVSPGIWSGLASPTTRNLCVHRSAVQTSEVQVWYTRF